MAKKKFTVEITETLQRQIEVKANNEDEAEQTVRDMYRNEEIVLSSDDYIDTEFEVLSSGEELQTYYAELYDSDDNTKFICIFETTKSLKEVEKEYNKAREDWYNEESPDCLSIYIRERLLSKGIEFRRLETNIKLDF